MENIKKNQSELKNIIAEMKNTLEGINSRLNDTEEHTSDVQDSVMEITQLEQQKEKQIFKNENSLRDLWDNFKCTLHFRSPRGERENERIQITSLSIEKRV